MKIDSAQILDAIERLGEALTAGGGAAATCIEVPDDDTVDALYTDIGVPDGIDLDDVDFHAAPRVAATTPYGTRRRMATTTISGVRVRIMGPLHERARAA